MSGPSPMLAALIAEVEACPDAAQRLAAALGPYLPTPADSRPTADRASEYLTTAEAADLLRCTPTRIRQLICAGRLPVTKDGRRSLIRRADLDAYLEHPTPNGRNTR